MRTEAQIQHDLKQALVKLEEEAEKRSKDPLLNYPCSTCRFYSKRGNDDFDWGDSYPQYHTCRCPLVAGFKKFGVHFGEALTIPMPCGPEKALWRPHLKWWEKVIAKVI